MGFVRKWHAVCNADHKARGSGVRKTPFSFFKCSLIFPLPFVICPLQLSSLSTADRTFVANSFFFSKSIQFLYYFLLGNWFSWKFYWCSIFCAVIFWQGNYEKGFFTRRIDCKSLLQTFWYQKGENGNNKILIAFSTEFFLFA